MISKRLLFWILIATLVSCNDNASHPLIPENLFQVIKDSLVLEKFEERHYGDGFISDGIFLSQVFDIQKRSNIGIRVYNTKTRKYIGEFPWPDPTGGFYFGFDFEHPYLYYFINGESLLRINTVSNSTDTVKLATNNWTFFKMIVWNNIAYSQSNEMGVDIVNTNNPSENYRYHHKTGSTSYIQNIISRPLSDSINMVGSWKEDGKYTLLGMTAKADSLWDYKLDIRSDENPISVLNCDPFFVLKYDSSLVVLNKKGLSSFEKKFNNYVYDILRLKDNKLLVILADVPHFASGLSGLQKVSITLTTFDVSTDQLEYKFNGQIDSLGDYFLLNNHLIWLFGTNKAMDISLESGKMDHFNITEDLKEHIRIMRDVKTGDFFLFIDGKLYW